MAIYYLAILDKFKNHKKYSNYDIVLSFYNLRNISIVEINYDDKKINQLITKIKKNIYDIINENNFFAKESLLCEWCYLWNECEVKSTSNPAIKA